MKSGIRIVGGGERRLGRASAMLKKRLARAETPEDRAVIQQLIVDAESARKRAHDTRVKDGHLAAIRSRGEKIVRAEQGHDYMAFLAKRRVDILQGQPKEVIAAQPEMYRLAGIDPRAGFEGRPPAFIPSSNSRTGMRNVARDPMRRMYERRDIEEHQYEAACKLQDLYERMDGAGMKTNGIPELIDGGKAPDVSAEVLRVIGTVRDYEAAVRQEAREILQILVIGGPAGPMSIDGLAKVGKFGRNRGRISVKLRSALDETARFLGLLAPKDEEELA